MQTPFFYYFLGGYVENTEKTELSKKRFFSCEGINRFPERLRYAMNGMSNIELARRCSLSESAIRNYLTGKSYPSLDRLASIAEACDSPLQWLAVGTEATHKNENNSLLCANPSESQPVDFFERLDLHDLVAILKTLEIEERDALTRMLGRKGVDVLTLLLEEGSLDLLSLEGEKREAALSLQELPPDRVREILRRIKQCSTLEEEVNYKHQASA
ncbi:helix-turn-helix domain-containing protein [Symbiopectobacterium sp. Eva_TO]